MFLNGGRLITIAVVFPLLTAGVLRAGIIVPLGDPVVVVRDADENGGGHPPPTTLVSNFFQFTPGLGSNGTPCTLNGITPVQDCQFVNATGQNWYSLFISIAPISPAEGIVNCQDVQLNGFNNCTSLTPQGASPAEFLLLGGNGIPAGGAFGFTLIGWDAGTTFSVDANVPEPGCGALLAVGLAALLLLRRRVGAF